jgi:hypothetical protein
LRLWSMTLIRYRRVRWIPGPDDSKTGLTAMHAVIYSSTELRMHITKRFNGVGGNVSSSRGLHSLLWRGLPFMTRPLTIKSWHSFCRLLNAN